MLSDKDKRDMLNDAQDPKRGQAFAQARLKSLEPMSWEEYMRFCTQVQPFFGQEAKPHKITGQFFKL